jgi:hypothetical protein
VLLAALPVALVALVAGTVSYSHIVNLGLRTGQSPADAHLLPLAVDGLIVGGSVILAAGSWLGWLGVIPGVGATLFANLESGLPHGQLAAIVATWPAIAFTVASFMLERWLRSQVTMPSVFSNAEVEALAGAGVDVVEPPASSNGHSPGWSQARSGGWS